MDRIASWLSGKTLLVTGATGFLGQPLVEKILWTAPDVAKIHVLIRPKRQFGGDILSPQERLEKELYQSSAFDRLRFRHGDGFEAFLAEKVVAVGGDISREGLGLSADDRARLVETVDLVINSAAVVSFDAPLDQALELNARGAARIAALAAECRHAILVHVSTAYVCGATDAAVPETLHHAAPAGWAGDPAPRQIVDPEVELATLQALVDEVREQGASAAVRRELVQAMVERRSRRGAGKQAPRREAVEALRDKWLERRLIDVGMARARARGWNDTYTYTKALGEQLVLAARRDVPTAIVRPAIIESSLSEPSPGWLDGLRMADPLIVAIGKGRLRALPLDPDVTLDLVPADMVVNAILAAVPRLSAEGGTAIYQVATGSRNPITMSALHDLILEHFRANPMLDREGHPIHVKPLRFPGARRFRLEYKAKAAPIEVAEKSLQRLMDRGLATAAAQRQKRRLSATRAAIDKLFYYGELYEPYLNLDCRFLVDRSMELLAWLTPEERRRYDFDVSRLNWRHYIHVHIAGVKKFILKLERSGTLEVDADDAAGEAAIGTIGDLLERSAAARPDAVALQGQRDGEWTRVTYGELRDASRALGDRLLRLGLAKDDRVVLVSENRPEWAIAYFGASSIGLVVVPLDAQTWHREVWATANFTEARAILASRACFDRFTDEEKVANEAAEEPLLLLEVDRRGAGFDSPGLPRSTSPRESEAPIERPLVESGDLASIIFTSGTPVDPRGAMHTHSNFLDNLFGVSRYLTAAEDDRFLSVLPLYHALEFTCGLLMPLYRGATVTYARSLKPKVLLETMREEGITVMMAVPTLFALLRDELRRRIERADREEGEGGAARRPRLGRSRARESERQVARAKEELGGRLRLLVSGGSALGVELYEDFRSLGVPIYEGYGLTETAPVLTVNPAHRSRAGSTGKPLPGIELRLYHTNKEGVGEIIVRTPSLMKGYWRNEAATARVLVDGWFHTGDLGWVDADGYLYLTGRIKDVIVTGAGKNVYPMDLEAIYGEVPEIDEIGVIGIKSGLTEAVHAAVVPDAERIGGAIGEAARKAVQRAIQERARDLPSYHRLQQVHLWSEPLPRKEGGGIDREAVRHAIERRLRDEDADDGPAGAATDPAGEISAELARLSGVPAAEIGPGTDLYDDLGLDSLQAIELLLFLDHRLGVALDDAVAERIRTVGELLAEVGARARRGRADLARDRRPRIRSARPFRERTAIDRALLHGFGRGLSTTFDRWFDLEVLHPERVPEEPPYLLASNHSSHLDTPAILAAVTRARGSADARRIHPLGARDYFFDTAPKRWFFSTFLNVVPIEREEASLAGLRLVKSILESGEAALIYPEGSRSRTGEIQSFKAGLGLLAWELGIPIVPVRVSGTYAALPAGRSVPKRSRVTVAFGEPLTMEAYREAAHGPRDVLYRAIAADVRAAVVALGDGAGRGESRAAAAP